MYGAATRNEGTDAANLPQAGSVDCVSDGKVSDKGPAQCKMWECSNH